MKATITFNLPDDKTKHLDAMHGGDWRSLVDEIEAHLRSWEQFQKFESPDEAIKAVIDLLEKQKTEAGLTYKT